MPILKPTAMIKIQGWTNEANGKKLYKWEWDGPEDGLAPCLPEVIERILLLSPWELEVVEDQTFQGHLLLRRQLVC